MDNAEVTRINKVLRENFGKINDNLPIFRLTWSTKETEYLANVGRIPKYLHDRDRWVLERLCEAPEELLPEHKHTYEPLWVFKHEDGTYQEPNEKAITFLVHTLLYSEAKKLTQSDIDAKQKTEEDKEVDEFVKIMEEEYPVLSAKKDMGEAIFLPGIQWRD